MRTDASRTWATAPPEDDPISVERDDVITVRLIGHFSVARGAALVRTPANTGRLVALLALRETEVPRGRTCELLWPDQPQDRARSHLRTLLHRIHRMAEGLIADADRMLAIGHEVTVDTTDWSRWATRILTGTHQPGDLGRRAPAGGIDLVDVLDDDWAMIEQERFRQRCMHAIERQVQLLVEQRRLVEAVDVGLSAIRLDPFRESVHQAVIAAHLAIGNRVDAVRHYELYAALLERELGVRPSHELQQLVTQHTGR